MHEAFIDKPVAARPSEVPDAGQLQQYLQEQGIKGVDQLEILQFPGGYSNLTFLVKTASQEMVLRKPPIGAQIKTAHDMSREFKVLQALQPVFPAIPKPIAICEDPAVIGAPFYLMERVQGVILRNRVPKGMVLEPGQMQSLSKASIELLAQLHNIDLEVTGLIQLGKPEGYIHRQVEGWVQRYVRSATDEIADMTSAAAWLQANEPQDGPASFIHNDFKYDNLVLEPEDLTRIRAVLDWEMATVGSPLMDLGTTLAYWGEATDSPVLKPFNLTWLEGNLTREEVLAYYTSLRGLSSEGFLFYYVFGCFKIGVIVQQIYARYRKGLTADPRFEGLIDVVRAMAANAKHAIQYQRISNFY